MMAVTVRGVRQKHFENYILLYKCYTLVAFSTYPAPYYPTKVYVKGWLDLAKLSYILFYQGIFRVDGGKNEGTEEESIKFLRS